MNVRPYLVKIRLKSKEFARRLRRPAKIPALDEFFRRHWKSSPPSRHYLSGRVFPQFFFRPGDLDEYIDALRRNFPASCREIMRRAADALEHKFNILGSGDIYLGEKINWEIDYKTMIGWPHIHYARVQPFDLDVGKDVKMPWELSRLQFLTDLGRAYLLSGDRRYRDKFVSTLSDWQMANPVDIGINWVCSMEVAIRAINIIWGLHLFSYGNGLETGFVRNIIRLLYYHGLHIEKNLEFVAPGSNSNHLIANYLGLLYLGMLFPEFDRSERWKKVAIKGLEDEIRRQVLPDGADYECSTSYHRLVLEMFLSAFILSRTNSLSFSQTYTDRLYRMLRFSIAMTAPSGKAPMIGDNDDGFVVKLCNDDAADHRPLIDVGLPLFGERVPAEIPVQEERLWYLGPASLTPYTSQSRQSPRLFKESGYAVIRTNDFHLLFNAASLPPGSFGGHKHNDLLSFTLEIEKIPFLIDPGTYCYSADYRMRNISRSTSLHNTVTIDNQEQSRFFQRRLFYLFPDARAKIDLWTKTEQLVIVSAFQDGYARLQDNIVHRRTISVSLEACCLKIVDQFTGDGSRVHSFVVRFITPLENLKELDDCTVSLNAGSSPSIIIGSLNSDLRAMKIVPTCFFPRYGYKAPAYAIEYHYQSRVPFEVTTSIAYTRSSSTASLAGLARLAYQDLENRMAHTLEKRR